MRRIFILFVLLGLPQLVAETWTSPATGQTITLQLLAPIPEPPPLIPVPVVFYLTNLAVPRTGTDSDEVILRDLRTEGYLVVVLDYARHSRARVPFLNRDLVELRRQLQKKILLSDRVIDSAHIFIVPSGHRLKRDIVYYRDAARTLAMDLIYPSKPAQPVGTVLEFSCDNANRMGNSSLDSCSDTILPGAAVEGFAVAMADHPVAAPYAGFDTMPDCARKIKAAVRTLRAESTALGSNGRIVPVGFSRGSGMALMLATTAGRPELDGFGEHEGEPSNVQGAVVMSGRFTYLDLLPNDKMVPHYVQTWGERATHENTWRAHGALDYLSQPAGIPLFLTINASESPDALHQMEVLRQRLTKLGSPFVFEPELEPRGHKMPLDLVVLKKLFSYLHTQLSVAPERPPAPSPQS